MIRQWIMSFYQLKVNFILKKNLITTFMFLESLSLLNNSLPSSLPYPSSVLAGVRGCRCFSHRLSLYCLLPTNFPSSLFTRSDDSFKIITILQKKLCDHGPSMLVQTFINQGRKGFWLRNKLGLFRNSWLRVWLWWEHKGEC